MAKPLRIAFAVMVIASLLAGFTLAGCAQQPTTAPTATSAPAKATSAPGAPAASPTAAAKPPSTPKAVASLDRITIGISQEPDTLLQNAGSMYTANIVKNALGTASQNSGTASLVWRNDKNEIIPGIAESVPTVDNGGARFVGEGEDEYLEVAFKLRKNVKWHDGTPVTAKDVKFNWETIMDPSFPISDRSQEQKIQDIDTPDDYTVVLKYMSQKQARQAAATGGKLKDPSLYTEFANQEGPVLEPLYNRVAAVIPQHLFSKVPVAELTKSEYARKPIGMGAYKLKEWVAGQSITLEANPDFFLGAPRIKTVTFKIIPDTNAIIGQLQTGELDVVTEDALQLANAPDFDRIEAAGAVKFIYTPAAAWEHVDMNLTNEFLKDINVRKAIAHGTDRRSIVEKVFFNKTQVIHSWIMPTNWAYSNDITKYEYSKDKAREFLETAGFKPGADGIMVKDGRQLKLKLQTTAGNKPRELTSQIIQQNLKDIGIAVELDFMPSTILFATEGKGPIINGTFELALYGWVQEDDPSGISLYHSKAIPTAENNWSGQNHPRWKNARNDELLIRANSSLSEKERKPVYAEQQKLFAEDVPVLPLYQKANVTAMKAKLQNFKPTPTNTPPTWNVHEWILPAS